LGDFFGNKEKYHGLGVILDTYDKYASYFSFFFSRKGSDGSGNHPRLMAVINAGDTVEAMHGDIPDEVALIHFFFFFFFMLV